ncbi:MAG: alpha/beta hydrolase [Gemmatimonadales bacterium]|jgi:pimeloyl-ACP methyl ester carboxylesterase
MPIADLNGQRIYYEDSGGAGPAVLFLHGFLMDRRMFDPQVEALSSSYRCVRFDARGFGDTGWDGEPFGLYDTAADGVALLDELGLGEAVWVGHSQGGYAALRAALRHSERVRALVLVDTRAGVDEEPVREAYRETRATWREHGPVPPLVEGLMTAIIGPRESVPDLWETWRPRWEALSGERIHHAMNNLLDRDDLTDRLDEIEQPALVIHGEADEGIPLACGALLARGLPAAEELVVVPGAWHTPNLTRPELVNPVLRDFLERTAG